MSDLVLSSVVHFQRGKEWCYQATFLSSSFVSKESLQKANFFDQPAVKCLEATALYHDEQCIRRDLIGLLYIRDAAIGREIQSVVWVMRVFIANPYIPTCSHVKEWADAITKYYVFKS